MNTHQLREWVNAGHEIGCHGATHTHFGLLSHLQRIREIRDARFRLEDTVGAPVRWLSPPFGWYDRHVLETARDAGYHGFMVPVRRRGVIVPPGLKLLVHTPVYFGDPRFLLRAKLDPSHPLHRLERIRTRLIHAGSWGSVIVSALAGTR